MCQANRVNQNHYIYYGGALPPTPLEFRQRAVEGGLPPLTLLHQFDMRI